MKIRPVAILAVVALVLIVVGVTIGYATSSASAKKPAVHPSASRTASVPPRTPTPSVTPTSPESTDVAAPVVSGESVDCFPVQVPVDNGPRMYAEGAVSTDSSGVPLAYTVASGDIIDFVAQRFGFVHDCPADGAGAGKSALFYLDAINQVRRGGYPYTLYSGDTLNLNAHHITSIGTSNGRVLNEAPPSPMPTQN